MAPGSAVPGGRRFEIVTSSSFPQFRKGRAHDLALVSATAASSADCLVTVKKADAVGERFSPGGVVEVSSPAFGGPLLDSRRRD